MSRTSRLRIVPALNLVLVASLVIVGVSAHSLGVLAERADYLADAAAIRVYAGLSLAVGVVASAGGHLLALAVTI